MIHFDVAPRATGKTTRLIRFLDRNPNVALLTPYSLMRSHYRHKGVEDRRIVTLSQVRQGALRGSTNAVVIDDLDAFIHDLVPGLQVPYVTSTGVLAP